MSSFAAKNHHLPIAETAVDWSAGRRAFLRTCGVAAAGAAAIGVVGRPSEAMAAKTTDADILNFALNLEYLEAEFYLRATTGKGLDDGDTNGKGKLGGVRGGRKVDFKTKSFRLYAEEITQDEQAHVKFLRSALGKAKVARPQIDLKDSFTAAARAAGLVGKGEEFDAFKNETNFLLAAFIFEDVGVTAYKGAARMIDNKDYLEAAAGLLAVEAYHAGVLRTVLYSLDLFKEAGAISDARDDLDGGKDLDQGIGNKDKANLVPTDDNGLAFSRTGDQVLSVVYLGGKNKGGFLPSGANA